jgi:hypothetical protein
VSNNSLINILLALIPGLLGGTVVAILNYYFSRNKTAAEIEKLKAETEKIRLDISRSVDSISAAVDYKLADIKERVIYDSRDTNRDIGFEFRHFGDYNWVMSNDKAERISGKGEGALDFTGEGILDLKRTNTEGRYEIWLQHYLFDGVVMKHIPKSNTISGQRILRVSCEVRVIDGEHTLRFMLKDENSFGWLAHEVRRVTSTMWIPFKVYLQVSPTEECQLRIDDENVSHAPSNIQIRNLVVAEKVS